MRVPLVANVSRLFIAVPQRRARVLRRPHAGERAGIFVLAVDPAADIARATPLDRSVFGAVRALPALAEGTLFVHFGGEPVVIVGAADEAELERVDAELLLPRQALR